MESQDTPTKLNFKTAAQGLVMKTGSQNKNNILNAIKSEASKHNLNSQLKEFQ